MINVIIDGFGKVGHGVRKAIERNPDMRLVAILTRRPEQVRKEVRGVPVLPAEGYDLPKGIRVDVVILCGSSKEDVRVRGPELIKRFNTVDSFDIHGKISRHLRKMDFLAKAYERVAIVAGGWDPGILSLMRILSDAFLPGAKFYTFWGPGVSQGHSVAVRSIKGVLDARAYTIPNEKAIQLIGEGKTPDFSKREMHSRLVYVVVQEGADLTRIEREIVTMPDYYEGYDTIVKFISPEEMEKDHSAYPHRGLVFTSGSTGEGNKQIIEFKLQLDSNPEFTASILVSLARAAYWMRKRGERGAFTMADVAGELLSSHSQTVLLSKKFM